MPYVFVWEIESFNIPHLLKTFNDIEFTGIEGNNYVVGKYDEEAHGNDWDWDWDWDKFNKILTYVEHYYRVTFDSIDWPADKEIKNYEYCRKALSRGLFKPQGRIETSDRRIEE